MNVALMRRRLRNQRLVDTGFTTPREIVAWLGAVQAQDYGGAKWALGMRAKGIAETDVDRAFDEGAILRTHVLRPTWHFLAPADIRWILALSAPRVHMANAPYYRKFELDPRTLARSRRVLERVLRDGAALTRTELAVALGRAGIHADGPRLAYLMMHAELEAVICSGGRRGKQFTYSLLEERVPPGRLLDRDASLAELSTRYFTSHGPATLKDFVWWSGLTVREARTGIELAAQALTAETIDGYACWSSAPRASARESSRVSTSVYLLPNYDEYLIAYRDRDLLVGPRRANAAPGAAAGDRDPFPYHLIVNGALLGSWTRSLKSSSVTIEVAPYRRLTKDETRAVAAAADLYGRFVNAPAALQVRTPRTGAL